MSPIAPTSALNYALTLFGQAAEGVRYGAERIATGDPSLLSEGAVTLMLSSRYAEAAGVLVRTVEAMDRALLDILA